MADPVYQDQPYMRKSFLFFSDVYLTGAVQQSHFALFHVFNVIEEFKVRRSMIKVKITIARTQDLVGNYSSVSAKETAQAAYERMEEKADSLLDQSNAMTELNDELADGVTVDEELKKLKREMKL